MNYYPITAALIIALIITVIVSWLSKRPFREFGVFFLLVFLATWAGQLWILPFGPLMWGIAWIPLIVVSIFFTFLMLALIFPKDLNKVKETNKVAVEGKTTLEADTAEGSGLIVLGAFFWIMLILLIAAIAIGYYNRMPYTYIGT